MNNFQKIYLMMGVVFMLSILSYLVDLNIGDGDIWLRALGCRLLNLCFE